MSEKCHPVLIGSPGRPAADAITLAHEFKDGENIPEHFHPEDQLVFASQGVMTVRTNAGTWVVPPLRAVWMPAGMAHSIAVSGPVAMRTIYFRKGMIRKPGLRCAVVNVSPLLRELILHACSIRRLRKSVRSERRVLEMIRDQLEVAQSLGLQLPYPSDPRARRVVQFLVDDPGSRATLHELCTRCGGSKRTIQRAFIAETSLSFDKWRRQLRLLHALRFLASGQKVTTAAIDAGYGSPSAFISMFKRHFGTTPTRYFQDDQRVTPGPR
jgi:AraC-like DNA-binding protein